MPGLAPAQKIKKGRPLVGFPNTGPVVTITGFDAGPTVSVATPGFTGTAIDTEQGDISASIIWIGQTSLPTSGFQKALTGGARVGGDPTGLVDDTVAEAYAAVFGAPAGATVPAIATFTYDLDVTFDVGGLQQLVVPVAVADDYDTIAATINGLLTNGTCAFVAGSFTCFSATPGESSALVAVGTAGTGTGGEFFVAVDAAAGGATTFPAPIPGTTTAYDATVTVDGGVGQSILFFGGVAQDYTTLLGELNADTTGATWSLVGGDLQCTSDSTGISSTILIAAGGGNDLFAALTDWTAFTVATPGVDPMTGTLGTGAAATLTFPTLGAQTLRAEAADSFAVVGFDTAAIIVV